MHTLAHTCTSYKSCHFFWHFNIFLCINNCSNLIRGCFLKINNDYLFKSEKKKQQKPHNNNNKKEAKNNNNLMVTIIALSFLKLCTILATVATASASSAASLPLLASLSHPRTSVDIWRGFKSCAARN